MDRVYGPLRCNASLFEGSIDGTFLRHLQIVRFLVEFGDSGARLARQLSPRLVIL